MWANQTEFGGTGGGASGAGAGVEIGATSTAGGQGAGVPWSFYPRVANSPQQERGYCYILVNRAASCFAIASPAEATVSEAVFVVPDVTTADIASFRPENPTLVTEPERWTVVGLDTNMIAGTRTHTVAGLLLGAPAEVRFTPATFDWNYGDGSSRWSLSAGSPWAVLGLPEFSPTETSHVFSQLGSFQPAVRVWYSLEYRWGSGAWTGINGKVSADATAPVLLVVRATNVLVQKPCYSGNNAPGC